MSTPMPERAQTSPLTDRARFPLWTREIVRYADTDRQGHVNNAVFATFLESARVNFFYDPAAPLILDGQAMVIARLVLDFRAEIRWPGTVEIGTAVLGIGRSSFTLGQGIFTAEGCAATAESVLVLTDERTRRSTPLSEAARARLTTYMLKGS